MSKNVNEKQLGIPFNISDRSKDNNIQVHNYSPIEAIIELEESIESLTRKSWDDKIDYWTDNKMEDFIIIDSTKNYLIVFLNVLNAPTSKLNQSTQIVRHWLFGQTMDQNSKDQDYHLRNKELDLFFKGNPEDIDDYRKKNDLPHKLNPSLDWQIYHFPIKIYNKDDILLKHIKESFGNVIDKFPDYELRISYGVVSKSSHQRSDKRKIMEFVSNFLDERGFDVTKPLESYDINRNGEPILLWINKNYIGKSEFCSAVGINFGYDNGLSGFRLGLGLYLRDKDLLLSQINKQAFKKQYIENSSFENSMNAAFKRWIHHKNMDSIENTVKMFFTNEYNRIFDNFDDLLRKSNLEKYDEENSKRKFLNTHHSDFKFLNEKKENIYNKISDEYGFSRFAHFLSWLQISNYLKEENVRAHCLADFIASCTLGHTKS